MSSMAVTADGAVLARFDEAETSILLSLSQQFAELVGGADDPAVSSDPALRRLFPDAYREDPTASAEFSRYTRRDLSDVKLHSAAAVQEALAAGGEVLLDGADGWTWLRHLADLRLTVAARLGVVDDPSAFDAEPDPATLSEEDVLARGVFDWLGYVQEMLVIALEDAADPGGDRVPPGSRGPGPSSEPA
jgi:hypothetical protein